MALVVFFWKGPQSPVPSAVGVREHMGCQGTGVTLSDLGQQEARSSLGGSLCFITPP